SKQHPQRGTTVEFNNTVAITNPQLWSGENPYLYTVTNEIYAMVS
ncbi:MAG: hypothetical protein HC867_07140, partial [Bacteroidia bacterium]|nr:hypothetical protein [Bacteroidia bacterium]